MLVGVTLFFTGGDKIIADELLCRFGVDVARGGAILYRFSCELIFLEIDNKLDFNR